MHKSGAVVAVFVCIASMTKELLVINYFVSDLNQKVGRVLSCISICMNIDSILVQFLLVNPHFSSCKLARN